MLNRPPRPGRIVSLTALAATLLAVVLPAASCAKPDKPLHLHDPAIEQARGPAMERVTKAVDTTMQGLAIHGSGSNDQCEQGQDNFMARDEYRWQCGFAYALAAGLPAADLGSARADLLKHLNASGCQMSGSTESAPNPVVAPGRHSYTYQCQARGMPVRLILGAVSDPGFEPDAVNLPRDRVGVIVSEDKFDLRRAIDSARAAGDGYLVIAVSFEWYFELLRAQPNSRCGTRLNESLKAQVLGDNRLHDLARATVDPVDARVCIQARDGILQHVSVSAMQL